MSTKGKSVLQAVLGILAAYAFAGWVYVAVCALVAPETLRLRLTHLAPWPREDTFGVICLVVSFAAALGFAVVRATR